MTMADTSMLIEMAELQFRIDSMIESIGERTASLLCQFGLSAFQTPKKGPLQLGLDNFRIYHFYLQRWSEDQPKPTTSYRSSFPNSTRLWTMAPPHLTGIIMFTAQELLEQDRFQRNGDALMVDNASTCSHQATINTIKSDPASITTDFSKALRRAYDDWPWVGGDHVVDLHDDPAPESSSDGKLGHYGDIDEDWKWCTCGAVICDVELERENLAKGLGQA